MRVVSERQLAAVFGALAGTPRIVVGGNFATPWQALAVAGGAVPAYQLFALNAQAGKPDRDGATLESPFVGPGVRGGSRPADLPSRLGLRTAPPTAPLTPDVLVWQSSVP